MKSSLSVPSLIVAAMLAVSFSLPADAGGKAPRALGDREAAIASLGRGAEFASDGNRYQLLLGVRALRIKKQSDTSQVLQTLGATPSDVIESRTGLMFVRRALVAGRSTASAETVNSQVLQPVAINRDTGTLGLMTGTIMVHLKNLADAPALASTHGLTLTRSYDHLGMAFFTVTRGSDVLTAAARLTTDPRVTRADPEVLEALRQPY